ncbi:hypothetical protein NCS56_01545900 [Fusarium sp. Ph1]|nr:hypothetical protein NCS56_01545900 [Fusarium sp. Ph1]
MGARRSARLDPQPDKICKYCGRKLKNSREHNKHVKIHEKLIGCKADPSCEVRKAKQRDMNRHYATAHKYYAAQKGIRVHPFPCDAPGCEEKFTRPDNLRRHYIKRHGKSLEAEVAKNGRMQANTKHLAQGRITQPTGREFLTTHASIEPIDQQPNNNGDDGYHDLLPEPTNQQPSLKRKRELRRGERHKRQGTRGQDASEATATPGVEDSGQSQDPRGGPESQMQSEAESGFRPHNQPQQVMENTRYKSNPLSYILNPEPSQDHSPRQAGPTASSCSTDGLPRHHDRLTSGDDAIGLAFELDYSKEASAMVQDHHSGHPVTALSAIAQSIEGEPGPRAAKPDSSGRSAQPTESRHRFKLRKAIQLATPVLVVADPRSFTAGFGVTLGEEEEAMGSPIPFYADEIQFPWPRASWPGRYGSSIHVLDELPDPPETGFSDEDAGSYTTLAGEEDRRSLTPAPASGRPCRRAYKQNFEGNEVRTRNTRE